MKMLGSPSWQLTEVEGDRAHVLLYIRDVAALQVPAEVDAPPRLVGGPPHESPVLDDDRRRRAGRDWADCWQALLEVEGREQTGTDGDDSSFWAWTEDLGRLWDAPEFWSLADRRALREVTLALYPEARRWVDAGPSSPARLRGDGRFAWATVRETAEGVAAERGVGLGEVRGRVMVLDVEGVWWRRVARGTALCSTAATEDSRTARTVLRDVFESSLA